MSEARPTSFPFHFKRISDESCRRHRLHLSCSRRSCFSYIGRPFHSSTARSSSRAAPIRRLPRLGLLPASRRLRGFAITGVFHGDNCRSLPQYTGTPSLYQTDPSGTFSARKANATGRNSNSIREFLEKNYKGTSGQETIKLAIRALLEMMMEAELCSSRVLSPSQEESGDEELSVLLRHTKVIVTGNNITKSILVGL
ncbi:Proteasome subunit alpha type-7 [Platanthera guangdongensis]|uniref:Proteasome subunit alpha type-7 n=1 Tax=Platanthera guangdongensis TaxID=2320717 RepID=A0ABR2LQP0_9ASPA